MFAVLRNPENRLTWAKPILRMTIDTSRGMAYLHSMKPPIIHRDLKSMNILVSSTWGAKVSDFGLSREKSVDETMSVTGTPLWLPPEMIRGERYTEKADVYSFGIGTFVPRLVSRRSSPRLPLSCLVTTDSAGRAGHAQDPVPRHQGQGSAEQEGVGEHAHAHGGVREPAAIPEPQLHGQRARPVHAVYVGRPEPAPDVRGDRAVPRERRAQGDAAARGECRGSLSLAFSPLCCCLDGLD